MRRILVTFLSVAAAFSAGVPTAIAANDDDVVVFAAVSLSDAVNEIVARFTSETGIPVRTSFAATSVLARQIEAGASADVFLSADEEWMDYLQTTDLLLPGSRRDLLGNELVLIAPADSDAVVSITEGSDLLAAIGKSRIATGDPDSVPAGRYARAALTKLGVWDPLKPQIIRAENVRVALAYVARGEVPFGIVYLTDARIEKNVRLLGTFPEDSYPPIRYPLALTVKADENAQKFADYLASRSAMDVFQKYGFTPLP